nr:glycosyltransferase family 4 protein [Paracoccus aestuariivivens]
MNFGLTARDRQGLREYFPDARITALPPFLDLGQSPPLAPLNGNRLVTVAMMRAGDKMDSYRALGAALRLLPANLDWRLTIAGDGPLRNEVRALLPYPQIEWAGKLSTANVIGLLQSGCAYVWPGCGEAFGLAYLEAQTCGLPVAAWATAGVPEVVTHNRTGLLAAEGDVSGLAANITRLLTDLDLRQRLGLAARQQVFQRHSLANATYILDHGLRIALEKR